MPNVAPETEHITEVGDARALSLRKGSVDLVVTSPPYPMIEMWDALFAQLAPEALDEPRRSDGWAVFESMHRELDRVWKSIHRALRDGGIACINIGDATRTVGGEFCLYPNHARILEAARRIGFTTLPDILWRKPTNAPNKFMGSGMYPPGAYVTYEHEYILVLRKGGKREFLTASSRENRGASAYFWEERNVWFSDVWTELRGARQQLGDAETRERSGAFPFELAYRLIQMFSVYGDTVLDPFLGSGTTAVAAAASGRSSIGVEIDAALAAASSRALASCVELGRARARERLDAHLAFVEERLAAGRAFKHRNRRYGFPVVTRQETDLVLCAAREVEVRSPREVAVRHGVIAPPVRARQLQWELSGADRNDEPRARAPARAKGGADPDGRGEAHGSTTSTTETLS